MKLNSWNVNGLREAINKGFEELLEESKKNIHEIQAKK